MNILGLSGQEREAAAALVQNGRVIAAIEEEKLARIRDVGMNYAGGLPHRAIQFCLERATSFYATGYESAALISADQRGDLTTTALMTGIGHELHINAAAHFTNALGLVYNAVTAALGIDYEGDWHKTMWLAPTGENRYA